MPVSRILIVVLAVIAFSLGVLLAQVTGERNVARTEATVATDTLREKSADLTSSQEEHALCTAALKSQNQQLADTQVARVVDQAEGDKRADTVLATLPQRIASDRTSQASAVQATLWVERLFH
ncbi:hypothetical protein D3C85_691770 [compost metagenome]